MNVVSVLPAFNGSVEESAWTTYSLCPDPDGHSIWALQTGHDMGDFPDDIGGLPTVQYDIVKIDLTTQTATKTWNYPYGSPHILDNNTCFFFLDSAGKIWTVPTSGGVGGSLVQNDPDASFAQLQTFGQSSSLSSSQYLSINGTCFTSWVNWTVGGHDYLAFSNPTIASSFVVVVDLTAGSVVGNWWSDDNHGNYSNPDFSGTEGLGQGDIFVDNDGTLWWVMEDHVTPSNAWFFKWVPSGGTTTQPANAVGFADPFLSGVTWTTLASSQFNSTGHWFSDGWDLRVQYLPASNSVLLGKAQDSVGTGAGGDLAIISLMDFSQTAFLATTDPAAMVYAPDDGEDIGAFILQDNSKRWGLSNLTIVMPSSGSSSSGNFVGKVSILSAADLSVINTIDLNAAVLAADPLAAAGFRWAYEYNAGLLSSGGQYFPGDMLTTNDFNLYISKSTLTSPLSTNPASDPTNWTQLTPGTPFPSSSLTYRGIFNPTTHYSVNDVVVRTDFNSQPGGRPFTATADSVGVDPISAGSAYWFPASESPSYTSGFSGRVNMPGPLAHVLYYESLGAIVWTYDYAGSPVYLLSASPCVTINEPGSLPPSDSTYPEGPTNYTDANSYDYWICAGGAGNNPPDPSWYCAVASCPGVVESRSDLNHHLNEIVYTATGSERGFTITLPGAPLTPSSLALSTTPTILESDSSAVVFSEDSWSIPQAYSTYTIASGVLTYNANGAAPANGTTWYLGGYWPLALQLSVIQIVSSSGFNGTVTANFITTAPSDQNGTLPGISYLDPYGPQNKITSTNAYSDGSGTIDYETGVVTVVFPSTFSMTAGEHMYANYDSRHGSLNSAVFPWENTAALQAGTGSATCTLQTQTFDFMYGIQMFSNSHWLVCRDFGYNLPSDATIKRVCWAWEGSSIAANAGAVGTNNLALVVGNQLQRAPYTQPNGPVALGPYYFDPTQSFWTDSVYGSEDDSWPDAFLRSGSSNPTAPWPGSTANDGSTEFAGSETWNQDYMGEGGTLIGLPEPDFTTTGNPSRPLTPADINDPGFGFAVCAFNGDYADYTYGGGDPTVNQAAVAVHSVRMIVYYTAPAANGTIIVQKATIPSGSAQEFTFNPSWASPFTLTDGTSSSFSLAPGTYSINETAVTAWNTVASTSNSDPITALVLPSSGTITVTFTNTFTGATLTVEKATTPGGSPESFTFNPSWGSSFTLSDGGNEVFQLAPGVYYIDEETPTGWVLTITVS